MSFFTVQSIVYEGEVVPERAIGNMMQTMDIKPINFRRQGKDELYVSFQVDFSKFENQRPQFSFRVTSTYLLMKFDWNNLNQEMNIIQYLVLRSFSNMEAILHSKFQDLNSRIFIPGDPDYKPYISAARDALLSISKNLN